MIHPGRSLVRPSRFTYHVDFSRLEVDVGELLEESLTRLMEGPRDPRLRRAIKAAASGWVSSGRLH